jgi:hypothetical protein
MSDIVTVALIAAVPGVFATVLGFLNNALGRRAEAHQAAQRKAMEHLEKNTNSIKDALIITTDKEAYARGTKDEKDRHEADY